LYPINAAVVGAGFIGPVHVEGLQRAGVGVTGILGVDDAESERAAARLGLSKAYRSYEELLADPQVQSVHIAVPNRLHYPMAKAALQAGKHVLCEKPLAMNAAQSRELVQLASQANVAAGVNYNIRYYPLCLEAAERARQGALGPIHHVCGSYVQDWLLLDTDYNWRLLPEEGGALRAVADIGTHWLDLLRAITGLETEAVCADLQVVHPIRRRPTGEVETFAGPGNALQPTEAVPVTTEDFGAVLIRFHGGARGCLWVSQVTAGRKNCLRWEIAAARHSMAWCSESPNELWIGHRTQPNQLLLRDPALLGNTARHHIHYPGGHNEGFPDTFKQCFRAFYDSIAADTFKTAPAFPTFADGHREVVLCEAILHSQQTQQWVSLTDNPLWTL